MRFREDISYERAGIEVFEEQRLMEDSLTIERVMTV